MYRGAVTADKTPLELAALATAAVAGLRVAGLRPPQYSDEVVSVTGLIDVDGNRWTVVCPHDTVGGLDLEAQTAILSRLARAHDADRIPFDVPRPAGFTRTPEGVRVMVHRSLGGRFMDDDDFTDTELLPAALGRALAALHNLPEAVCTGIDLPAYSAIQCRDRHLAILDEAASTTVLPANLWNRWEAALEDVSLWRFRPAPVHGDLQATSVMVEDGIVRGMTGFSSAHVGDPAIDVSWVLAQASDAFLGRFRDAYSDARDAVDLHLFTRAQLVSELALVRWLVHGVHAEDDSVVEDARGMLAGLSADLGDAQLVRGDGPQVTSTNTPVHEDGAVAASWPAPVPGRGGRPVDPAPGHESGRDPLHGDGPASVREDGAGRGDRPGVEDRPGGDKAGRDGAGRDKAEEPGGSTGALPLEDMPTQRLDVLGPSTPDRC